MADGFLRTPRKNIDIDEIIRLYAEGLPLAQIARKFGTTHTTIGDRLKRRGVRIRGRGEALQILWRGAPSPNSPSKVVAGITSQTKAYFSGNVAGLRSAGLWAKADEIECDIARANELAVKFGVVLHSPDTGSMT